MNLWQNSHKLIPFVRFGFVIAAGVAHMSQTELGAGKEKKKKKIKTRIFKPI